MQHATNSAESPRLAASWREHGKRFRRRIITLPVLALLWGLLFGSLAPLLLLLSALDLLRPMRPWARCRALLAIFWIVSCEVVGVLGSFVIWLAFVAHRNPARFLAHNTSMQRAWTSALFSGSKRIFNIRVQTKGLEQAGQGPFIVLVRHASLVDTVLTAAVVANPNQLRLRYVLKDELLGDPCIDIVGNRLQNAFVSRGSKSPGDLRRIGALAHGLSEDEGVLIYPEGTRFSSAKLERARRRLEGDPVFGPSLASFRHVLPPRPGGTLALLQEAPNVDVVFLAHRGLEGAASLGDFWRGDLVNATLRVEVWRMAASEIPASARQDASWLLARWVEMDAWVEAAVQKEAG